MLLAEIMDPESNGKKAVTKTPALRASHQFVTPARKLATPLKTPSTVHQPETPGSAIVKEKDLLESEHLQGGAVEIDEDLVIEEKKEEKMKANLEEWLFPKWQGLLATRSAQEPREKTAALERFDPGGELYFSLAKHKLIVYLQATFTRVWCTKRRKLLAH